MQLDGAGGIGNSHQQLAVSVPDRGRWSSKPHIFRIGSMFPNGDTGYRHGTKHLERVYFKDNGAAGQGLLAMDLVTNRPFTDGHCKTTVGGKSSFCRPTIPDFQ